MHRHVEVVASGGEGRLENGRVEAGIAGVDDDVGAHRAGQFHQIKPIGGIDASGDHVRSAHAGGSTLRSYQIDIGHHDVFEHIAPGCDRHD